MTNAATSKTTYNLRQVADLLGATYGRVWYAMKTGDIKGVRLGDHKVVCTAEIVEELRSYLYDKRSNVNRRRRLAISAWGEDWPFIPPAEE